MTQIPNEAARDVIQAWEGIKLRWPELCDEAADKMDKAVLALIGTLTAALGAAPDHVPDAGKMVGAPEPDMDLRLWGWAPGGYLNKCSTCQQQHSGTDKRSWRCRPCAIASRDAATGAAPAAEAVTGPTYAPWPSTPLAPNPPAFPWTTLPSVAPLRGCVCPPGANKDCENPTCPRKGVPAP